MKKCPVCGIDDGKNTRLVIAWCLFGILIGLVGGQLFSWWQFKDIYKDRMSYLEKANEGMIEELKKGVPMKPPPLKKPGITY